MVNCIYVLILWRTLCLSVWSLDYSSGASLPKCSNAWHKSLSSCVLLTNVWNPSTAQTEHPDQPYQHVKPSCRKGDRRLERSLTSELPSMLRDIVRALVSLPSWRMVLYMIGLGLCDEKDISIRWESGCWGCSSSTNQVPGLAVKLLHLAEDWKQSSNANVCT